MARFTPALFAALTLTAACAAPKGDDEGAEVTPIANATDSIPFPPAIVGIQTGYTADSSGFIGSVVQTYTPGDTIVVSTATRNVPADETIEVQLSLGARMVASARATTRAPGADGRARHVLRLAPSPTWAAGTYRVEAFMNGTSYGFQEITVAKAPN